MIGNLPFLHCLVPQRRAAAAAPHGSCKNQPHDSLNSIHSFLSVLGLWLVLLLLLLVVAVAFLILLGVELMYIYICAVIKKGI